MNSKKNEGEKAIKYNIILLGNLLLEKQAFFKGFQKIFFQIKFKQQ